MQALGFGTTKGNQVLGDNCTAVIGSTSYFSLGNTSVLFLFEWLVLVGPKINHPAPGWLVYNCTVVIGSTFICSLFANISVVFYDCPSYSWAGDGSASCWKKPCLLQTALF